jgi:cholesterol transport system auxiliary component
MRTRFRRSIVLASSAVALAGCGSLLESKLVAPQAYVLRLPPRTVEPLATPPAGSVLLQRPEAGPGLDSNRIALLRSDQRFDFYAATLWAAPAPDLVESVLLDALRAGGAFSAVFDDSAPFAPQYDLRITLRRFEADYTSAGAASGGEGGGAPTVHVVLDCTLGRHRDRTLLASFTARGMARAGEDRVNAVVAAFQVATATAVAELERAVSAAIKAEPRVADPAGSHQSE